MNESTQKKQMGRGLKVIIALAVLTMLEYIVAVSLPKEYGANLLLVVIAIIKAWFVLDYFMHIFNAWRRSGESH